MKSSQHRQAYSAHQARRGVFLIDLLITISIASVVLATGVGLIIMIFRVDTAATAHLHATHQTSLLSSQFRKDVHRATAAELLPEEEPKELRLTLADEGEIRWEIKERRLIRTRTAGEQTARDVFSQAAGTVLSFGRTEDLIRLSLQTQPVKAPETVRREITIEALLNRSARWMPGEDAPEQPEENED